jgi:hypothetical protein
MMTLAIFRWVSLAAGLGGVLAASQALHIMSPDDAGKTVEWSFEMQAVQQATSGGWRPDIVRPGDKISVQFHPLRDGSRGGELLNATLGDGRKLQAQAARLPVPQAP